MSAEELPKEILYCLEKLLKQRVVFFTQVRWVHESYPKLQKCSIVLGEDTVSIFDENFDKCFSSIKYENIVRVLVDTYHEQALQVHFTFDSDQLTELETQFNSNSTLNFSALKKPAIIFAKGRRNLINHLALCWKSNSLATKCELKELSIFQFNVLQYSEKGSKRPQISYFKSLEEPIPPRNEITALGENNLIYLKGHRSYLIGTRMFQIDRTFEKTGHYGGRFNHKQLPNIRIQIESGAPMPHTFLRDIHYRQSMQVYAESIFQSVILPDLIDHQEDDTYFILLSQPYNKKLNVSIGQGFTKTEGWIIQIRTLFRDIFLIVCRDSFLPPLCSCFSDYYVILFGDFDGTIQDLKLSYNRVLKQTKLKEIACQIVDTSTFSKFYLPSYNEAVIQQLLDAVVFQTFEEYNYFWINCKLVPTFMIFGLPFLTSTILNQKYRTGKEDKILEELQKRQLKGQINKLLQKSKDLIDQLSDKMTPFEAIEKFLQRSIFVNSISTRIIWLQKLSFLLSYTYSGALHPQMVVPKLLSQIQDDEEYFAKLLSFFFFLKEKQSDMALFRSQNKQGLYIPPPSSQSQLLSFYQLFTTVSNAKKDGTKVNMQEPNLMVDLQKLAENPDQFDYNEEVLIQIIESQLLLSVCFDSNQTQILYSLYLFFLKPTTQQFRIQVACIKSIIKDIISNPVGEQRMQFFKDLIVPLLQLCQTGKPYLIKLSFEAIEQICIQKSTLLPELELLKDNAPNILVNALKIVDLNLIRIIIKLIMLIKTTLEIFVKLGISQRILQILNVFQEIEGTKMEESMLLEIEDILLILIVKQDLQPLDTDSKKIIFNLLKSSISFSPNHLTKVLDMIKFMIKKDLNQQNLISHLVNKLLTLVYTIDKNPAYEKNFCTCLELISSIVLENSIIKNKLKKDFTFKGVISIKRSAFSDIEMVSAKSNLNSLPAFLTVLWEELYDQSAIPNSPDNQTLVNLPPFSSQNKQESLQMEVTVPNQEEEEEQDSFDSVESHKNEKDRQLTQDDEFSPLQTEENQPVNPKQVSEKRRQELEMEVLGKFLLQ